VFGKLQPGETPPIRHNFAWKEQHGGRELIVHRKGATPAGPGFLGVIPGSIGTAAYVVRGKGNADSLHSASHGAGRVMSRKQANKTFNYREEIDKPAGRGITVLSAGADEVCGVSKNHRRRDVGSRRSGRAGGALLAKIVRMCGQRRPGRRLRALAGRADTSLAGLCRRCGRGHAGILGPPELRAGHCCTPAVSRVRHD
jgi:hypothetical protein